MKNAENKEQIIDLVVHKVFIFYLHISNNYRNAKFGMQRFKDDVLGVSIESTIVFT
jgi:hypothetical protein